ncbi:hypothetical protein ACIPLC_15975 [Kitasatospora sp. NPDC086801]|uniref:hypothetical protein n=1 Tax=Kitasatospora sp. NPDC086801 TaxID=3364066 RepID=UPI00381C67B2
MGLRAAALAASGRLRGNATPVLVVSWMALCGLRIDAEQALLLALLMQDGAPTGETGRSALRG